MRCKDIITIIDKKYPEKDAMSWDNVGLQVGDYDKEVEKIYIAVDATDEVIADAVALHADMLITHHPMIFSGLKKINNRSFLGRRVITLIRNDIAYYAMHTNYDIYGMADKAMHVLGFDSGDVLDITGNDENGNPIGIGKVLTLDQTCTLSEMAGIIKEVFHLEGVRVFGEKDALVHKIAICPGSGKSDVAEALAKGADVYVSGDLGHHDCIDAVAQGMNVIDAGHYGIEHIYIKDMFEFLQNNLEGVEVISAPIRHPFFYV